MWIWAVAVGAVVAAWLLDRRRRLYADLPPTPAAAVFAGRNEVVGRAWVEEPLTSRRTKAACVWWEFVLEEEREHTRTVTQSDGRGGSSTRTERYRQWHEIDRASNQLPEFDIVDRSGSVPVRLAGAKVIARLVHKEVVTRDKEGGFFARLADSRTGRYREIEHCVSVGDTLFVAGEATFDPVRAIPVFADDVLVSTRSEETHLRWLSAGTAVAVLAAVALVAASVAVAVSPRDPSDPIGWIPGLCVAALGLGVAWAATTYNRLRLVAQGVVRARSLVGVQLHRRHDLIPALADVVRAHAAHESDLLETLATDRTRAATGDPPSDDPAVLTARAAEQTTVLRQIFALGEEVPDLRADESFASLRRQLADTEGRIAGSRTFYNDSLMLLRDRRHHFPSALVARWIPQADHEMFAADGFERTVPEIARSFATAEGPEG